MVPLESKRVHFCPSVSALRAQSLGLNEQSEIVDPTGKIVHPIGKYIHFLSSISVKFLRPKSGESVS